MEIGKVIDLIRAICARFHELEGTLNKTKLIKLLYLIDVEHYRLHKITFTGFNWIFYEFGPWAYEYIDIFERLESSPDFIISKKEFPQTIHEISCIYEKQDLSALFPRPDESILFKQIINKWALEDLNKLLNYVYFYTEPMIDAKKHEKLDFSKIDRVEEIPDFKLKKSGLSNQDKKQIRNKLKLIVAKEKKGAEIPISIREYDEVYRTEIEKMNLDYDY